MRQRRMPFVVVAACLLFGPVATPSGQAPPAGQTQAPQAPQLTFRVETNYVEVEAFITDKTGAFIRDLSAEDFEVLEDGKPQSIATFALVDIPIERDDPTSVADDVIEPGYVVNDTEIEGRFYLIVLDTNHVAALRTAKTKEIVRDFIVNHMASNDQAAVMHVNRAGFSQDFTSDKRKLLASLDRFVGERLRSPALNKFDDLNRLGVDMAEYYTPKDRSAGERTANARQSIESLRRLIDYMLGMRGRRKALFLVSEGLDMDLNDRVGPGMGGSGSIDSPLFNNTEIEAANASLVSDDLQLMIETATRANVAVYSVDPRGLADTSDEIMQFSGIPEQPPGSVIGGGTETTETKILPTNALRRELRDSQQLLRSVAEQTGGAAIVGTNNFGDGFRRIVRDSSTYYVLGYRTPPKFDGKFHEITVRVKRPGAVVRARKGYHAASSEEASGPPPDVLKGLLSSPMPLPGLTMRATSTVVKTDAPGGAVRFTVEIDGEKLDFQDRNGTFGNKVEMQYLAMDLDGNVKASATKTMDLALTQDTREAVAFHGLRYTADLALPPGRYQIRLAAKEAVGNTNGSLFWEVEVPDFAALPFAMTNILVSSARVGEAPTVNDAKTLAGLLPGPVTAARTFDLEDTLVAAVEIYDRAPSVHSVDLSVRVKTDDGIEIFRAEESRESGGSPAGRTLPYVAQVPLKDLVPGRFVLTVEARSRLGETAAREIVFHIR